MAIVTTFSYEYKQQFAEYVSLLFYLAKRGTSSVDERIQKITDMTEAYFSHCGKHADSHQLDRLGYLILYDDMADRSRMKSRDTEFPVLSEDQLRRREAELVSFKLADEVGNDGRDYRPKTRDSMRKFREMCSLY